MQAVSCGYLGSNFSVAFHRETGSFCWDVGAEGQETVTTKGILINFVFRGNIFVGCQDGLAGKGIFGQDIPSVSDVPSILKTHIVKGDVFLLTSGLHIKLPIF